MLDGVFTVPGDGFDRLLRLRPLLAEIGYEGWVVVEAEQDPAKAPPCEYSAMGRRHLADAFGAAGFTIRGVSAMIAQSLEKSLQASPARSPSSPAGPRGWARRSPICSPSAAPTAS